MPIAVTPNVIRVLAEAENMRNEFPFLRFAYANFKDKVKRSCCGGKKASATTAADVVEKVKAAIAYLNDDRVAIIKKELKTDKLVITLAIPGGTRVVER